MRRIRFNRWAAVALALTVAGGGAAIASGAAHSAVHAARPTPGPVAPPDPIPTACVVLDGKADARCTSGATNPDVTQSTIKTTICTSGWTKTVRPPVSFTNTLKIEQMKYYNETGPTRDFEEDHLVPLELGGAPDRPENLWPQPRSGAHSASEKDQEENALHRDVCSGKIALVDAQSTMLADWRHA